MKRFLLVAAIAIFFVNPAFCGEKEMFLAIESAMSKAAYEEAITKGEECLEEYPESHLCYQSLGWAYLKAEKLDLAQEAFDQALALNDQMENAYVGKGVIYRKKGDLTKARESYLKAIETRPENAEAYASLLVIELMQGHDEKAVEYGKKAWELRKDYPIIPANLAVAYHYAGNVKQRDYFYEEAKKLGYRNLDGLREIFSGKRTLR
jgi:tetratricopeptide (TPR) repeat protein